MDGYTPQPGDVALLAENGTDVSAVGIVAELCPATDDKAAKVAVIEADASGTVRRVEYAQGDAQLAGYAILPQNPDYAPAAAETAEPEATATPEPVATAMLAPEFDEQAEETNDIAVYADDATEEKTITSITAKPKSDEPIMAGTPLTLDMFTVTAHYSDGTSIVLSDPVTVKSPDWPENYPINMAEADNSWTTTLPGVKAITVTFDADSMTESNYDIICLYDKSGTWKETLSGTAMAGKTYTIPGDMVKITMSSDGSDTCKGFSAAVTAAMQLSLKRAPTAGGDFNVTLALQDKNGNPTEISTTVELTAVADNNKGICGDDAQWNYDDSDGILTITGTGSTYDYTTDEPSPWNKLDVQKLVVEEGVARIGKNNFAGCNNLQSVTIPASLSIDEAAFTGCTAITELYVAASQEVQHMAAKPAAIVKSCTGDLKVTLEDGVDLPERAFRYCKGLKSIQLVGNMTAIPNSAFEKCESIVHVELPDTITQIGDSAFSYCSSLASVDLPAKISSIGRYAFFDCESLKDIVLPKDLTVIEYYAFGSCVSIESVHIPDSVKKIGGCAFDYCKALREVSFGEQSELTIVDTSAFYRCNNLTEINLPESVKTIGSNAFDGTAITSLTIPQNVETVASEPIDVRIASTQINWNAKNGVWNEDDGRYKIGTLTITVGKSVEELPARTMQSFVTCGAKNVRFEGQNWLKITSAEQSGKMPPLGALLTGKYYVDESGALYRLEDGYAVLAYVPAGLPEYTVPETVPADETKNTSLLVTAVAGYAFNGASDLVNLTFQKPEQITEVSDYAFANAGNLSAINGATTVSAVRDKFSANCKIGFFPFVGTKITDGESLKIADTLRWTGMPDRDGKPTLEVTVQTYKSTKHLPPVAEDGTKVYYTNEAAVTSITVSNPSSAKIADDDGAVVRLYMDFDSEDGQPQITQGDYTIGERGYKYTVTKIPGINRYCFEIQRPLNGDTIALDLKSGYASPKSGGGTNRIYGAILSKTEKEALKDDALPPITQYQNLRWETKADTFPVTKERVRQTVDLQGDGEGHAYVTGLKYSIKVARSTENTLEGVGKDLMAYMDYADVLTLPKEITISDKVHQAIAENSYRWTTIDYNNSREYTARTADGEDILELYQSTGVSNTSLKNYRLAINKDGKLVIYWTIENTSVRYNSPVEMPDIRINVTFLGSTLHIETPEADKDYEIRNDVSVTEHFSYSGDKTYTDDCSYAFKCGKGYLRIYKTYSGTWGLPMGSERTYTLSAYNPAALPYEGLAFLDDEMPSELYLSASNIAELFQNDLKTKQVTLTIQNATICDTPTPDKVYGMDGTPAGTISVGNTDSGTSPGKYNGMNKDNDPSEKTDTAQITVTRGEDEGFKDRLYFTLSDKDGTVKKTQSCTLNATAIQTLLDDWGYLVTYDVRYKVRWDLRDMLRNDEGKFILQGGQRISRDLKVTFKNTFMMLDADQKYQYPSASLDTRNDAYGRTETEGNLGSNSCNGRIEREFSLLKDGTINGQSIVENSDLLANNAIIDYALVVKHTGDAHYDLLPLTDHMSGAQVLLAEVEKNRNAEWAKGLEIITADDGKQYYKLEADGTYNGVWLNDHYADSVKVTASSTGRDTLIKWYFSDYEGARSDTIHYKALLQLTGQESGRYLIYNESWLGDHETHRLYDDVGWTRLDYTFDKKIVEGDADLGDGKDYCPIEEGKTITYRLKLQTLHQGTYTLSGTNLSDALPKSLGAQGGFQWKKGDNQEPGTVNIVKYAYEGSSNVINPDSWSITTDDFDASRQCIKWANDFSVTISQEPVYIYVQLTFPTDDEWQEYTKQYGTQILENTFYVEGVPDKVTHALTVPAKAYLQKGVWETVATYGSGYGSGYISNSSQMGRWYYCNDDLLTRYVGYYVVLRNDGQTRLYLNDMQDVLPKGFTFASLSDTRSLPSQEHTEITSSAYARFVTSTKADGTTVSYKTVIVNASADTDSTTNTQKLTFHFTLPTDSDEKNHISYDGQRGKCYLNPGEAIQFAYYCRTNDGADTGNTALNTVTMPYYDYTGGGVNVGDGKLTALKSDQYTPNDGDCKIWDNSTAASNGFTASNDDLAVGGKNATQWLESHVTVTRGGISPGITKKLAAKIDQYGNVTNEPLSAHPTDTLRWEVIAQNNGTLPIIDYTISDTLPSPYEFSGWITYKMTPQNSTSNASIKSNLLKLEKTDNENVFKVTYQEGYGSTYTQNRTTELTLNGEAVEINVYFIGYGGSAINEYYNNVNAQVSLTRDEETQATTLWIHFMDQKASLPEGTTVTLTYETVIPSNTPWRNTVYTNSCNITPMVQPWDTNAVNQGNATKQTPPFGEEQEHDSVRNSAPVTVAFGYTTSSQKSVEQVGNADNKATSDDDINYIVLPDASTKFRYKLEVNNADPANVNQMKSMNELILIDSLPEPDDHTVFQPDDPRYSAFKVSLADDYKPVVTITNKGGKVTTLQDDQYTLEYSTKTTFADGDWDGTNTTDWRTDPTGARSLRLKLKDPGAPDNPLMPSGCKIALSFTCKVDDPKAAAGQIAWNSFGYHYKMNGADSSQEAAPLKVGVMLPTRPTLQKKLQLNGAPYAAEQEETFTFYCYTGLPLTGLPDNWKADDLEKALTADGRKYQEITLTVPAGKTESEVLTLNPTDEWTWTKDTTYTLVEVPTDNYTLATLGGLRQSSYTFTYDPAKATAITAVNDHVTWNFTIEKVDADAQDTHLADAWFALYSPDERDAMTDDAYNALTYKPDRTVEVDSKTWHLTQVGATKAENGFLTFSGLLREKYSYKEFRAPNGYTLDDTLCTITRKADSTQFCTVTNKSGYVLPKTGGCGTTPFTAAGLLLTTAAVCLLYRQYKRRRGKTTRTE